VWFPTSGTCASEMHGAGHDLGEYSNVCFLFMCFRVFSHEIHEQLRQPRPFAFAQGGERKPGHQRIPVNSQDEDGLAAVHWAAMRGILSS
jgi:hypothetical protein